MSLQAREASTLVIVTFLASASLLLLAVPEKNNLVKPNDIPVLGFWFASVGLVYRQFTVWTIVRIQYNRDVDRATRVVREARGTIPHTVSDDDLAIRNNELARHVDIRYWRHHRGVYYATAFFREFLVLFFLSIPIALWLPEGCHPHILCQPFLWIHGWLLGFVLPTASIASRVIFFSVIIALIFSVADLLIRRADRHFHH